jgi:hypothetical protein
MSSGELINSPDGGIPSWSVRHRTHPDASEPGWPHTRRSVSTAGPLPLLGGEAPPRLLSPEASRSAAHYHSAPERSCHIDGSHGSVAAMIGFSYNRLYSPRQARTGGGGVCAPSLGDGGDGCGCRQPLLPAPLAPCIGSSCGRCWTDPLRPRLVPLE